MNVGGEVDTYITVALPEATRANSADGLNLYNLGDYRLRYILEIYLDGSCQRHVMVSDDTSVAFPVRLAPGRDYQIAVWADIVETSDTEEEMKADRYYFTQAGLDAISIIETEWNAMDETRDAYAATKSYLNFSVSDLNEPIKLVRPMAKLRVVATDIDDISALGLHPTTATVEYTEKVCSSYNVLTGTATTGNTKSHTITYSTTPYTDAEGELTLFTDYLFVTKEGTSSTNFTLDVIDQNGRSIKSTSFNTDIAIAANKLTTIKGDVLTVGGNIEVIIEDNEFDGDIEDNTVGSAAAAQAALDNAVANTTIRLEPGVNYGTLVFRQTAASVVVDITDAGGDAQGNEKYRRIENLTIVGAEGAVVDGFDFQVSWIDGSGASYIDVKNLTVKNVTFSGTKTPFNFEGSKGSALGIDGLTIENCKMTDENHNDRLVFQQISGYKALNDKSTNEFVMTAGIKNLTITNCEVTGAHMVIESRAMENLIITNNTFTGIKQRDMLITSDTTYHADKTYTGEITITGNTSIAGEERFIRGSLNNSDAVVVIKNNTIKNYLGSDPDYIKVTDGNNVTIENNTLESVGVGSAEAAQAALDNATSGTTIELQPGVNYSTLEFRANPGHSNTTEVNIADAWRYNYVRTIENVKIIGAQGAKVDGIVFKTGAQPGDCNNTAVISNLTIDGVEFTDAFTASAAGYNAPIMITTSNATVDGLTVKNCKLIGDNNKLNLVYLYGADGSKNVTISGNTVYGIARLCELRGTENVTITNNTIKNTYEHAMLLAGSNYSGSVTITGNTAEEIHDRFVRMAGAGNANVTIKDNTIINYRGEDTDYIKVTDVTDGNNVTIENNVCITTVASADELKAALANGGNIVLAADIAMTEATYQNVDVTIDGNGHTISQAEGSTNNYALFDSVTGKLTLKNIVFDGIKGGAVLRTTGAELTLDNITVKNCEHTEPIYGLFRLIGKNTIKNSKFENNKCISVITFNTEDDNNTDPQIVQNCEFKNNTCSATAVVHYSTGGGATIDGNKFVGNTVNCDTNGATLYMGFQENCVITNNLFQNNTVNESNTSSRVAGGVFFGYEAVFTGNAFIDNTVTGENAVAKDVCVSTYYTSIALSGNYWGGNAPVEDTNYFVQHKSDERTVIINDYLTANPFN